MAVKACTSITLFHNIDIIGTTYYYKLVTSLTTPNVPDDSVVDPTTSAGGSWSTSEPSYVSGSTGYLYYTIQTKFSDGTQSYSYANIVSGNRKACLSSSYEAAKEAYNKATNAQQSIDNLQLGGRNYILKSDLEKNITIPSDHYKFTTLYIAPALKKNDPEYKTYVFSLDAKYEYDQDENDHEVYAQLYFRNEGNTNMFGMNGELITREWKRYSFAATFGSNNQASVLDAAYVYFRAQSTTEGVIVYGKNFKVEKGNKSTDWTPAPEDTDEAIINLDNKHDYIVGTQTAATNAWKGVASFASLHDGQEITYWLPWAGTSSGATLNLTLSGGNTTGAKNVYYGGTNRVTTHYPAGTIIRMVYRENVSISGSSTKYTGWWCDANYDTNNTDRLRFQNNIKTNKQYIWASRLLVSNSDGYFPLHSGVTFDRDKAILWAGSNLGPWVNSNSNNNFVSYSSWDMRNNAFQYYNSGWKNGTQFNLIDAEIASGKKIYSGDKITGTSTTATIFSGSGITSAAVGDYYINTSSSSDSYGYYYRCTVAGAASAAKWVYEGDSTIPGGKRIYWGAHLTHTNGTAQATATAISSASLGDRYINHTTGRLYECTTAGASGTAKWTDRGVILRNNKTVYLKCELQNNSIIVDDVPFTTETPTEEDGKTYIAIGMAYQVYACSLFPEHPMFMFKDGMFKSLEQITYDSSETAKRAASDAITAKSRIEAFLDGENSDFEVYKRSVTSDISTATGEITNNFSTYMRNSTYGQTLEGASSLLEKIDSYIRMTTNSQGQPYMELGVQPSADIPNTYRLRIENDEIYMVYGSGDTETLTKLTSWSTRNGKSKFEVNTLVTQQEMAIEPFRFIKNDDGSLSFRKVE